MTISRASLEHILENFDPSRSYPTGSDRLIVEAKDEPSIWLETRLGEVEGEEISALALLPEFDEDDRFAWSARVFLTATLLHAAAESVSKKSSRRKSFRVEGEHEVAANLTVKGDLELAPESVLLVIGNLTIKEGSLLMGEGARLIVLGDARVESDWIDETTWCSAAITGNLNIHCSLFTSGDLYIGRDLFAPFIHAAYSPGALKVMGGLKAKMLIDDEHRGSAVFGQSEVSFAIVEELQGIDVPEDEINLNNLRNVLLFPELVESEPTDFFEMTERIIEMVEAKKPIFTGDDPGWIFARA